jgi:uracil-DNA glycosylase
VDRRAALVAQIIDCERCELHAQCTLPVPFSGDPGAILIIGEAPGEQEDHAGRPFVGPAGILLRSLLVRSGFDPDHLAYCNTASCLSPRSLVFLGDGSTRWIVDLVRERYDGEVMCVDREGRLTTRRVIGWHKNALSQRRVFHVSHEYSRRVGRSVVGIDATGDHEVLTQRGWVRVEAAKAGDKLHTGMIALDGPSLQVVLSGILGDGALNPRTKSEVTFCSGKAERDYITSKRILLQALESSTSRGRGWPRLGPLSRSNAAGGYRFTVTHPQLKDYANCSAAELVERLDDFGIALWYMDDGHLRMRAGRQPDAQISIARMGMEEAERCAGALRRKGFIVRAKASSMGPRLMFGVDGTRVLLERIARFIHPSHARKHPSWQGDGSWPAGLRDPLWGEMRVEEVERPPSQRDSSVYCLSVEELENFVTVAGVVHNCYPNGAPSWDHVRSCDTNKWDQIAFIDPTWILLLGKVALRSMRPDLEISAGRSRPFVHRNRICFASFHPAAALRNAKYERGLKRDVDAFARLVHVPDWQAMIPDDCSACDTDAIWWEESGLGWCERHLPEAEREGYDRRMRQQLDELDAVRRRDLALAQVADAADPTWMEAAWDALVSYLQTHKTWFSDDFWAETDLVRPRESRALGPVVLKAARQGLMKKSGEFRPSVASNMQSKPIWDSLIYKAEAAHG